MPIFSSYILFKVGSFENIYTTPGRQFCFECKARQIFELVVYILTLVISCRAPLLKRLELTRCCPISSGGFADAIKKLHLLEELQLYHCLHDEACPCLKSFRLVRQRPCSYRFNKRTDDREAFAIAKMHRLRSLKLVHGNLSNQGLAAIIDNCPHLEYLTIRDCCNVRMDANLTAKCARIRVDYHEYFPSYELCKCCFFSPINAFNDDGYPYDDDEPDDYHDLSLYSYLGDEIDGTDCEEHERILDVKSMRRYLS
jgi:hypothetical protein